MEAAMRMMAIAGAIVLAGAGGAAWAQKADKSPPPPPAVYQAVIDCGTVAGAEARLACFDGAVAALSAATRDRQVVVVDRSTMREARRGIFGLSLPKLRLFGGDDDSELVTSIDSTITGVRVAKDGMAIFVLEDGGRWKQTEGRNVYPKVGQPIHIKQAAMGSYMANVNKQPGVRVVRLAE
jgi:hypothetical protein